MFWLHPLQLPFSITHSSCRRISWTQTSLMTHISPVKYESWQTNSIWVFSNQQSVFQTIFDGSRESTVHSLPSFYCKSYGSIITLQWVFPIQVMPLWSIYRGYGLPPRSSFASSLYLYLGELHSSISESIISLKNLRDLFKGRVGLRK